MAGKYRPDIDWAAIAKGSETIVVYMGVQNLPNIVKALVMAGLSLERPVALIRWGTRPEQTELIATLGTVVAAMEQTGFAAPAIAVIGPVVNLHPLLAVCRPKMPTITRES